MENVPALDGASYQFKPALQVELETAVRMQDLQLVGQSGEEAFEATATALCGGPAEPGENLARVEGVEVSVDSSYPGGYSPAPLNDGLLWPTNAHWTQYAWASAETGGDHWVRFNWDEPRQIERVIVYWNVEGDRVHTGRSVVVEIEKEGRWMPLGEAKPEPGDAATTILLSPTLTDHLRVTQPEGMGSEHRPNLMWVTEIQVGG